jgi:hypothetical protein
MANWEADYAKMKEDMIYEENKPSYEDLISNLKEVRKQLQSVEWTFDLEFTFKNYKKELKTQISTDTAGCRKPVPADGYDSGSAGTG